MNSYKIYLISKNNEQTISLKYAIANKDSGSSTSSETNLYKLFNKEYTNVN